MCFFFYWDLCIFAGYFFSIYSFNDISGLRVWWWAETVATAVAVCGGCDSQSILEDTITGEQQIKWFAANCELFAGGRGGGKGADGVWGEVLELNESRCEHSQHWVKYYSVCDSDDGGGNNSLLAPVLWCWWHVQTFAHAHYYLSNGGWKEGVNIWFYMITAAQHTESVFVST